MAYETVLTTQPGHIDARINLSTILQQLDQPELALDTLKDLNLDSCCSHIPVNPYDQMKFSREYSLNTKLPLEKKFQVVNLVMPDEKKMHIFRQKIFYIFFYNFLKKFLFLFFKACF